MMLSNGKVAKMPNKLTDKEIKKALEWCEQFTDNLVMANIDTKKRTLGLQAMQTCKNSLDLINRLQADYENYKQIAENQQSVTMDRGFEIKKLQAENERLRNAYKQCAWERDMVMEQDEYNCKLAKAEAYKEFAERLKEYSIATFTWKGIVMVEDIDEILKELVGEDKQW